jgi:hypothetical protein
MNRNVLPSTRTSPVMGCEAPVQCFVSESVRLSVADQTLKYGSWTISGVDGGRNCAETSGAIAKLKMNNATINADRFIEKFLFNVLIPKTPKPA